MKVAVRGTEDEPLPPYATLSKTDKGKEYCKLRDEKDRLEALISEINLKLEALVQLTIKELEQDGMNLFRLDSGDTLSIKDEPYVSVEDRTKFLQWIKETSQEDLLTVNYMTMSSIVKGLLQSGENPPPGIKVFLKQSITRRQSRG